MSYTDYFLNQVIKTLVYEISKDASSCSWILWKYSKCNDETWNDGPQFICRAKCFLTVMSNTFPPLPLLSSYNVFRYSNKVIPKLPDIPRFIAVFSYYCQRNIQRFHLINHIERAAQTLLCLAHCYHFWIRNKLLPHFHKWNEKSVLALWHDFFNKVFINGWISWVLLLHEDQLLLALIGTDNGLRCSCVKLYLFPPLFVPVFPKRLIAALDENTHFTGNYTLI